ncbi:MAG: right-handed parallel beta-helix repeat-containing protein [Verrucomicrobiota bacterium]
MLAAPLHLEARIYSFTPESKTVPELEKGDTLLLKPGTYRRSFEFSGLKGDSRRPITIKAETPGTVIFRGDQPFQPNWKPAGDGTFQAITQQHPHMLFHGKHRLFHEFRDEEFSKQKSNYQVSRKEGKWLLKYRPETAQPHGPFTRGNKQEAFHLVNCEHIVIEGIRFQNYGCEKAPIRIAGVLQYGGDLVKVVMSNHIIFRNNQVDGWMGTAFDAQSSSNVTFENCKLTNGYGRGIAIGDSFAGTPTTFNTNNTIINCEVSHIRRFDEGQLGFSVEALSINGNSLKNTKVLDNFIHHMGPYAASMHFDVRFRGALVEGNLFYKNHGIRSSEIDMENRIEDIIFRNNLIIDSNYEKTIKAERGLNITLQNNLIHRAGKSPIDLFGVYNWKVERNIISNPDKALFSLSEQVLHKQKVDRGLITIDGKNLYLNLKRNIKDRDTLNERLRWAGVSPLKADGSYPTDISWKSAEEVMKMGYEKNQFMSARQNPNGNATDIDVPAQVTNSLQGNLFFSGNPGPSVYYYEASKKTAHHLAGQPNKPLTFLFNHNPAWTNNRQTDPEFVDATQFDFRQAQANLGPDPKYLAKWQKVLLSLGEGSPPPTPTQKPPPLTEKSSVIDFEDGEIPSIIKANGGAKLSTMEYSGNQFLVVDGRSKNFSSFQIDPTLAKSSPPTLEFSIRSTKPLSGSLMINWKESGKSKYQNIQQIEVTPSQWTHLSATIPEAPLTKNAVKVYFATDDLSALYFDNIELK